MHGYHICKENRSSVLGEELQCICEVRIIYDFYTVKVVKTGTVWK